MARILLFTTMLMLCSTAAVAQTVQASGSVVVQVQPVAPPPVYVQPAPVQQPGPVYIQPQPVGPVYMQPVQPQPVYAVRGGRMRAQRYDGGPIPPGARLFRRRSGGLLALGIIAFVPAYAISALVGYGLSYSTRSAGAAWFYVPAVGAAIGGFVYDSTYSGSGSAATILGTIDSIVQIAGLASFFLGMRGHMFVEYVGANEARPPVHRAQWMITPQTSPTYAGLNLSVFNL